MKKFFICLLALLMLIPLMAACENTNENVSSAAPSDDGTHKLGDITLTTPIKDLNGQEFTVLCWDFSAGSKSILGYTGEIIYAEDEPGSVDEAKKEVIEYIEEAYNCKINGVMTSTKTVPEIMKEQVLGGGNEYQICFTSLSATAPLVSEGILQELNAVPTINLSDPWWDQNAVKDLSIGNKVYFTLGDINTYDDQGTWCMLFNKNMKEKFGITEDFYQLARDGAWTFDKFAEICTSYDITSNSNGDGVLDEKDTWAFGTETYNIYVHVVAGGQKITKKDNNDLPYICLQNEKEATYSILADVLDFYNNQDIVMVADAPPYTNKGFPNVWEATVHKAFVDGRQLFYMCGLIHAASFRVMEDEFGILPIPKAADYQDRYYHTVSVGNSTVMSIPSQLENVEDVGTLVTAIAELSMHKVTPAYYDVQLKYRDSHDDESGEMLDIIFGSRTFDLGNTFNWGDLRAEYMAMDKNYSSRFDSKLTMADTEMKKLLKELQKEGSKQ